MKKALQISGGHAFALVIASLRSGNAEMKGAVALCQCERTKDEAETKFQLTDADPFTHHNNASAASFRP